MTGPRILIVDDNVLNIELVSFMLEQAQFDVCSAQDALAAQAVIPDFQPALILMDIQLPGMDGLELTWALKNDPATANILIVAFTAYAMKGDEARMRAAGCDGYIAKPIDVANFIPQLQAMLAHS